MTEVKDKRSLLRIKIKSLAAEARIIRREELRTKGSLREEMYRHRTHDVRLEARATQLAYGLIRGRTEQQLEPHRRPMTDVEVKQLAAKVAGMLKKYGPPSVIAGS